MKCWSVHVQAATANGGAIFAGEKAMADKAARLYVGWIGDAESIVLTIRRAKPQLMALRASAVTQHIQKHGTHSLAVNPSLMVGQDAAATDCWIDDEERR